MTDTTTIGQVSCQLHMEESCAALDRPEICCTFCRWTLVPSPSSLLHYPSPHRHRRALRDIPDMQRLYRVYSGWDSAEAVHLPAVPSLSPATGIDNSRQTDSKDYASYIAQGQRQRCLYLSASDHHDYIDSLLPQAVLRTQLDHSSAATRSAIHAFWSVRQSPAVFRPIKVGMSSRESLLHLTARLVNRALRLASPPAYIPPESSWLRSRSRPQTDRLQRTMVAQSAWLGLRSGAAPRSAATWRQPGSPADFPIGSVVEEAEPKHRPGP